VKLGSNRNGPGKGGKKDKRERFSIFENNQPNEFKHKFEFKHFKNIAPACMQWQTPIFHYSIKKND
jgi:hypothetical protein